VVEFFKPSGFGFDAFDRRTRGLPAAPALAGKPIDHEAPGVADELGKIGK